MIDLLQNVAIILLTLGLVLNTHAIVKLRTGLHSLTGSVSRLVDTLLEWRQAHADRP